MNFSAKSCKNCLILWKSTKTHRFRQNYAAFSKNLPCFGLEMNLSAKRCKKCLISWGNRKNHRLGQNFATYRTNYHVLYFDQLFRKKLEEVPHFVKKHQKPWIWQKLATFRANYDVFAFSWSFQKEVAKSASLREKARQIIDLANTMQLFQQTTMFLRFDELYGKNLQKLPHFVKKHENSSIWPKLCNFFEQTIMFLSFDELFSKRLQKVAQCEKKHQKSSIWPNFATFRGNYHVFAFRSTFQERVVKSASFRKKARQIRFGQIFITFRTNYHVFAFRWTFQEKVAKSASFHEKTRKSIDLAKTCNFSSKLRCLGIFMNFSEKSCKKCFISWKNTKNHRYGQNLQFFEQTTMSWHFHELFRKKMQKVPHFVKKHEKSWISPKLATFRKNYHVFTFRWTLWQKVAETASFREKARKLMDLAKTMQLFRTNCRVFVFRWTFQPKVAKSCSIREKAKISSIWPKLCNFSNKLPCLCISMNFSGKSCKKCLISWKSTKYQPFGQNFQLFEQTTMSLHFHELFSKKLQKVPHSVENHEKSSISPKLCNFFDQTTMSFHFDQLLGKKLQKVPHFVKQHKKSSICPNLCNFSNKLPCFCISMNFQGKSCQKCFVSWKSTKNHRFRQHFATFRADYHVLGFRWSFQQKVTKSASFREKARNIVDLAKTRNFSNKLPCFDALVNFSAKSCRKCFVFWENSTNHRLGQNLQLFEQTTMLWHFDELFRKSGPFREKARTLIHLAKTCNFSKKLPCFGISMIIAGKSCKKVEKVAHFVKNDEKSSIWPKLATFRGNYHVSAFLSTFQQKVSHFVKKHEKSSFGSCLAHS